MSLRHLFRKCRKYTCLGVSQNGKNLDMILVILRYILFHSLEIFEFDKLSC